MAFSSTWRERKAPGQVGTLWLSWSLPQTVHMHTHTHTQAEESSRSGGHTDFCDLYLKAHAHTHTHDFQMQNLQWMLMNYFVTFFHYSYHDCLVSNSGINPPVWTSVGYGLNESPQCEHWCETIRPVFLTFRLYMMLTSYQLLLLQVSHLGWPAACLRHKTSIFSNNYFSTLYFKIKAIILCIYICVNRL